MKPTEAYLQLQIAIESAPEIPPCQVSDPEAWFPVYEQGENSDYRQAKKLCAICPVKNECLRYALAADEPFGVWGGLTPKERSRMRAAKNRLAKLRV